MEWVAPLLAGLGLGTLLTTIANHLMTRRASLSDRLYQEKREAYLGLLNAIYTAASEPSDTNAKSYAHWHARCKVFGADDVERYAGLFADMSAAWDVRGERFEKLVAAMRADLAK